MPAWVTQHTPAVPAPDELGQGVMISLQSKVISLEILAQRGSLVGRKASLCTGGHAALCSAGALRSRITHSLGGTTLRQVFSITGQVLGFTVSY